MKKALFIFKERKNSTFRLSVLLILIMPQIVSGQILNETFNYGGAAGNLTAVSGTPANWTAISGAGSNPPQYVLSGLSLTGYQGSNGAVTFVTSGEDDIRTNTTQPNTGNVYCAALVNLSAVQNSGDHFFGLQNGSTLFSGRVFAKGSAGVVNFGLGKSGIPTYSTASFALNTTYLLVIKYTFNTVSGTDDVVSLWVLPSSATFATENLAGPATVSNVGNGESTGELAKIAGVLIRQGTASAAPAGKIDEIRLATTWEDAVNTSVWNGTTWTPPGAPTSTSNGRVSADLTLSSNLSALELQVDPTAALTVGTNTLATGKSLLIRSDATGTGRIGNSLGGTITGSATVERYISSTSNRAYRLLAPAVTTSTSIHDNWQEVATSSISNPRPGFGTHITGTTTDQANGLDATLSGQSSLFIYDQTATPQTWNAVTNTSSNTLNPKTGYLLFVRGDRSIDLTSTASSLPSTNTTLRATGTLLTQDQTFTGLESNGRFSLVTNPYASSINWANIIGNASNTVNFEDYYTYWDPNGPGGSRGLYVTVMSDGVNSGGPGIFGNENIQTGQAFFVKAKTGANTPTLTIREADKSATNNVNVFRTGNPESLSIQLKGEVDGVKGIYDGVFIRYNNDYSAAVDGNDAQELANFDENIAIARDGKMLSIESRPLINTSDNIPLSIARLKAQSYEWQLTPLNFAHPNLQAYLQDKFLNTQTPISLKDPTIITFNVTADGGSAAADRFTVVFAPSVALPISMTSVKASQKSTGIQVEWNVLNEMNIDKYEVQKSADGINFVYATTVVSTGFNTSKTYSWYDGSPNAENNFYRIRSISKTGAVVYSEIVKISLGKGAMLLSVYPNPIHSDVIGLQLSNLEKGKYTINLINQLGQKVYSKMIDHSGGSASQTLQIGNTLSKGIYQLQLKGEHANITQQIVKQ